MLAVVALLALGAVIVAFVTSETATETHSFPAEDVDVLEAAVPAGDIDIIVESREDIEVSAEVTSNVWSPAGSRVALVDNSLSITGDWERK